MNDEIWKELGYILEYMKQDMIQLIIKLYSNSTYKVPKKRRSIYLEQENAEQLFLDFLRAKLGEEYYQIGKQALQDYIFRTKDEHGKDFKHSGLDWSKEFYQIELNYNLSDVITYAHEYTHYLQKEENTTIFMLGEALPIFVEQLATIYLKEQFPHEPRVYLCDFERYKWNENYIDNEYICLCEEHLYTHYSLLSMRYILGLLIACKLYHDYLLSPKRSLEEAKAFFLATEKNHFNEAMQAIGLNVHYKNYQLYYSDDVINELVRGYQQHYQQIFQEYHDLNAKRLKFWK